MLLAPQIVPHPAGEADVVDEAGLVLVDVECQAHQNLGGEAGIRHQQGRAGDGGLPGIAEVKTRRCTTYFRESYQLPEPSFRLQGNQPCPGSCRRDFPANSVTLHVTGCEKGTETDGSLALGRRERVPYANQRGRQAG